MSCLISNCVLLGFINAQFTHLVGNSAIYFQNIPEFLPKFKAFKK
jgi:hypothetical protein